jgi:tRNA(fMet)-specific endonuclease VapC
MDSIVISAVTQAELLYGLARKGHPAALANLIREFLLRVQILPWDGHAATVIGDYELLVQRLASLWARST